YNRLKLGNIPYFMPIGYTGGWGHFHVRDDLFAEFRDYLREMGHPYADKHRFGHGPNWRLRTTRAALHALGLKDDLLRHGIQREVFRCFLAGNASQLLRIDKGRPHISGLLKVHEIGEQAVDRWMAPRALRRPEYRAWSRDNLIDLLKNAFNGSLDS